MKKSRDTFPDGLLLVLAIVFITLVFVTITCTWAVYLHWIFHKFMELF